MQTLVNLEGAVEKILEKLVKEKYYSNKSEAIRAGILELGQKWLLGSEDLDNLAIRRMQFMDAEVRSGKSKAMPFEEIARKDGYKIQHKSGRR